MIKLSNLLVRAENLPRWRRTEYSYLFGPWRGSGFSVYRLERKPKETHTKLLEMAKILNGGKLDELL